MTAPKNVAVNCPLCGNEHVIPIPAIPSRGFRLGSVCNCPTLVQHGIAVSAAYQLLTTKSGSVMLTAVCKLPNKSSFSQRMWIFGSADDRNLTPLYCAYRLVTHLQSRIPVKLED